MATKTLIEYVDDLDGTPGAETVRFSLDGTLYEIDLNGKHAKALRKAVAPFTAAGRPVRPKQAAGRPVATRERRPDPHVGEEQRLQGGEGGTHPP